MFNDMQNDRIPDGYKPERIDSRLDLDEILPENLAISIRTHECEFFNDHNTGLKSVMINNRLSNKNENYYFSLRVLPYVGENDPIGHLFLMKKKGVIQAYEKNPNKIPTIKKEEKNTIN